MDEKDLSIYIISLYYRLAGRHWNELNITSKVTKDLIGRSISLDLSLTEAKKFSYKPPIQFRIANERGTLCEIEIAPHEIFLYTNIEVYSVPRNTDHFIELTAKACYLLCSAGIELTEERADVFPIFYQTHLPYLSKYMLASVIHNINQLFDVLSNFCSR